MSADDFVLDRTENPHPRMLTEALEARALAGDSVIKASYWGGFLAAMCAATGESAPAMHAWLDRHEKFAVYLAGPINGCTDDEAHGWRNSFMADLPGFRFLDPMRRDYRGKEDESVAEIVAGDIADIDACDIFLAYCWQVSWGTAMEIFYAYRSGKRVVLVVPEGSRISPWLRYHSHSIVPTLSAARVVLRESLHTPGS